MHRRWIVVLCVVGLIVATRAALPWLLTGYVNRVLDRTPGYRGHVDDVDLALLRGAYRIEGLALEDAGGDVPVPLLDADVVDFSVRWSDLLRGQLTGEIEVERPVLNLVAGPTREKTQSGSRPHWSERVEALFPFRIERFEAHRGALHFRDPRREPPVDVALTDLEVQVRNLTNVRHESESGRAASAELTGTAFGSGRVEAHMDLDPLAREPDFRLRTRIEDVALPELNAFFRAYGGFDVERGTLTLVGEVDCAEGGYEGYLKPLVHDLDVLDVEREGASQSLLQTLWEAVFGSAAEALQNQVEGQQGARIPLEGRFSSPQLGLWGALESLLRNAFVDALQPRFEGLLDRRPQG